MNTIDILGDEETFRNIVESEITEFEDNKIEIELYVIMQYGINISTVANNIIERVKYSVENTTSIKVSKIDVNVQGIRVK